MNVAEIFEIVSEEQFIKKTFEIFEYQYYSLPLYSEYCTYLKKSPKNVKQINEIPFLPISFFKSQKICSVDKIDTIFESSGTTNTQTSKHYIADLSLYEHSFITCFNLFYGSAYKYLWLALMPDKNSRPHSSLIYMVEKFIEKSSFSDSGFYLEKQAQLFQVLLKSIEQKIPVVVIGLTYSLLDFAENYKLPKNNNIIVVETGGMKGKRKELIREEVHKIIKSSFNVKAVHSEYGMTELLSQAYSVQNGIFKSPPWLKIMIRDLYNPLIVGLYNLRGGINIIDLANVYSCSFIETEDLGILHSNNTFEVLGRVENANIRGCNIMIS